MTRELTYRQAINEAMSLEMRRDPTVIVLGEDVAGGGERPGMIDAWGGAFGVTKGLITEFGPERVRDTPISETGFLGAAVGAALAGLRPVVDLGFVAFFGVCLDQISNQASKIRYMFGGQASVPVTVRATIGAGICAAAQHSDSTYSVLTHFPGLKCAIPSNPYDAKGMLISAIRDDNPVIFFENKLMYNDKGPVPEGEYLVPLGKGEIKRQGSQVTVVAFSRMVKLAMQAAEAVAKEGIEIEVIDPRCSVPLDEQLILESVHKTGKLVVVDEDHPRCGMASEIAAVVAEKAFHSLKAPILRVTPPDTLVPYSPPMEQFYMPNVPKIVAAVKKVVA